MPKKNKKIKHFLENNPYSFYLKLLFNDSVTNTFSIEELDELALIMEYVPFISKRISERKRQYIATLRKKIFKLVKKQELQDEKQELQDEKQELQDEKQELQDEKQELQDEKQELQDEKHSSLDIDYDKEKVYNNSIIKKLIILKKQDILILDCICNLMNENEIIEYKKKLTYFVNRNHNIINRNSNSNSNICVNYIVSCYHFHESNGDHFRNDRDKFNNYKLALIYRLVRIKQSIDKNEIINRNNIKAILVIFEKISNINKIYTK